MCLQARLKNWKGSGNVFQSLRAAALKAAAAEEEVTVRWVNKFADNNQIRFNSNQYTSLS